MFAVIALPNFRLQAALRFREELRARPAALIDPADLKAGALELNEAAKAAGVEIGQTPTQALARCATLAIVPRHRAQEESARAALLEVAGTLSPAIEATASGVCTVDLRSSRERDWRLIGERMVSSLAALQLRAQAGVAANPDLALIAARHAQPVLVVDAPQAFLGRLDLRALDPEPDLLAVLRNWGIRTLGQLTRLPRGQLMDRLGPAAAQLWDRAAGKTDRPLRLARAVEEFTEVFDFEREVETVEPLLFILRRFLDQLAARLRNIYRVAGRMTLTIALADGGAHEREFTVPMPTADVEVLFRILHTHLEDLRLPCGATGARLRIEPAKADRQQFQLFESPLRDANRLAETLGRLAALVGSENAGVAEVLNTHKPDSFRLQAPRFHEIAASKTGEAPEELAIGLPLRRWRPPIAAQVRMTGDHPTFVTSAKVSGEIVDALGPYRASGHWWEDQCWIVEEWDIEVSDCGLYRLQRVPTGWFIAGCYDGEVC